MDISDAMRVEDVAGLLGIQVSSVRSYKGHGRMPDPDGYFGRTPYWHKDTITNWIANRPGRGAGGGRPRKNPVEEPEMEVNSVRV